MVTQCIAQCLLKNILILCKNNSVAAPTVFLVNSLTAIQGDLVTLNCNPVGWPTPTVVWTREGNELILDSRVTVTGEGQLAFSNIVTEDTGTYTCTASNSIGVAMASTTLTVLGMEMYTVLCIAM